MIWLWHLQQVWTLTQDSGSGYPCQAGQQQAAWARLMCLHRSQKAIWWELQRPLPSQPRLCCRGCLPPLVSDSPCANFECVTCSGKAATALSWVPETNHWHPKHTTDARTAGFLWCQRAQQWLGMFQRARETWSLPVLSLAPHKPHAQKHPVRFGASCIELDGTSRNWVLPKSCPLDRFFHLCCLVEYSYPLPPPKCSACHCILQMRRREVTGDYMLAHYHKANTR